MYLCSGRPLFHLVIEKKNFQQYADKEVLHFERPRVIHLTVEALADHPRAHHQFMFFFICKIHDYHSLALQHLTWSHPIHYASMCPCTCECASVSQRGTNTLFTLH